MRATKEEIEKEIKDAKEYFNKGLFEMAKQALIALLYPSFRLKGKLVQKKVKLSLNQELELRYCLAQTWYHIGKHKIEDTFYAGKQARREFEKLSKMDLSLKGQVKVLCGLALTHQSLLKHENKADELLDKALIKTFPETLPFVLDIQGLIALDREELLKAILLFNSALSASENVKNPKLSKIKCNIYFNKAEAMGKLFVQKGKGYEDLEEIRKVLKQAEKEYQIYQEMTGKSTDFVRDQIKKRIKAIEAILWSDDTL